MTMQAAVAIAAPGLIAQGAHGQDATVSTEGSAGQTNVAVEPAKSPLSLQLNFDCTSAYFYHGIMQEDTGFIFQPALKLTINVYEQDDVKVDVILGNWNSFQSQKTGAQTSGDFTDYWYESDLLSGLALTVDKFSVAATYVILTSPSDAYETVQELDLTFGYDDLEALGKWAMHPYALLAFETGADGSDGPGTDPGTYLELGIGPGFSFDAAKDLPVSITFPVSVGLSLNDYYQDAAGNNDTFGFFQLGVKGSVPLPFGTRYGAWTLNAGVFGMFLGDQTSQYNGGQDAQLIAMIGLQANF